MAGVAACWLLRWASFMQLFGELLAGLSPESAPDITVKRHGGRRVGWRFDLINLEIEPW